MEIQQLFDIKQKFLRTIPHPKLIKRQIEMLEIKGGLNPVYTDQDYEHKLQKETEQLPLSDFLEKHITDTLNLKASISQARAASDLRETLLELYHNRYRLFLKLNTYLPNSIGDTGKKIKQSDPLDAYEILKVIISLKLKENEINPYLCGQLTMAEEEWNVFVASAVRAYKILQHG